MIKTERQKEALCEGDMFSLGVSGSLFHSVWSEENAKGNMPQPKENAHRKQSTFHVLEVKS